MLVRHVRKRGLHRCLSRQVLLAMLLVMLASTTTSVMLNLQVYIIQLPQSVAGLGNPPEIERKVDAYSLGILWMIRLNVSLAVFFKICLLS